MTKEERAELVMETKELVPRLAGRAIRRFGLPEQMREELVSVGHVALLEAAARFDPSGGASFAWFAGIRINGAFVDQLRRDKAPNEAASEALENVAFPALSPEERAALAEETKRLRDAVYTLSGLEKALLKALYMEGISLTEFAKREGISKSWASRIHQRALKRTRDEVQDMEQER